MARSPGQAPAGLNPHTHFHQTLPTMHQQPPSSTKGDKEAAGLEWGSLLRDGTVLLRFSDHEALMLHPLGSRFVIEDSNGRRRSHLSRFSTSTTRSKLRSAVDFRNFYSSAEPRLCPEVVFDSDLHVIFEASTAIQMHHWRTRDYDQFVEILQDGSLSLSSADKMGRIVLSSNLRTFTVYYASPLPFPVVSSKQIANRRCEDMYQTKKVDHMWIIRSFSTEAGEYPQCWQDVLNLAINIFKQNKQPDDSCEKTWDSKWMSSMPQQVQEISTTASESTGMFRDNSLLSAARFQGCSLLSKVEWTPDYLLRYLDNKKIVEITCFESSKTFILTECGEFLQEIVGLTTVSTYVGNICHLANKYKDFSLEEHDIEAVKAALPREIQLDILLRASNLLLEHKKYFASNACVSSQLGTSIKSWNSRKETATTSSKLKIEYSSDVHCESEVDGIGRFTAFCDGRVRAVFRDRCIGELEATRQHCRFVLPSGRQVDVNVRDPFELDGYVSLLQQYSEWAFLSENQRYELHEEQRRKQIMVEQELRKIHMFTTSRRLINN